MRSRRVRNHPVDGQEIVSRFGRWVWLAQAATGIALIALVAAHWIAQHYVVAGGERSYAEVADYLQSAPALAAEVVLLVIVSSHALLGMRAILLDYAPSARVVRIASLLLVLVGVAIILYGVALIHILVH